MHVLFSLTPASKQKKKRLEQEIEENENNIELLQSLAVKLTEAISKQELLIISRRPIQTRFTQEPSASYSQPAVERPRSAGDVTEQFVKWERETLEALIDLSPSDAAEQESRCVFVFFLLIITTRSVVLAPLDDCKLAPSSCSVCGFDSEVGFLKNRKKKQMYLRPSTLSPLPFENQTKAAGKASSLQPIQSPRTFSD